MIKHGKDEKNPFRNHWGLVLKWKERQPLDGLSSLNTTVSGVTRFRTHLRIMVKTTPEPPENKIEEKKEVGKVLKDAGKNLIHHALRAGVAAFSADKKEQVQTHKTPEEGSKET